VSHDMEMINKFTNRSLWLERGILMADGPSSIISSAYENGDVGSLEEYSKLTRNEVLERDDALRRAASY
jgi:ABC-type glutathione transport system ATPase component